MKHVEASTQIYFTTDYGKFKMINGNRQLNERKINRIIEEIQAGNDMLKYYPIQVKENKERLDILDGQHRFWICKKLKLPVFYIIVKEHKSLQEIAKVNSNVEKWKNSDFINCYVQQGNKSYSELQIFCDKFGINIGTSSRLLSTGDPVSKNWGGIDEFKYGNFECKFKDEAYSLANDLIKFNVAFYKDRSFIIAIHRIKAAGLVSIDDLVSAHKRYPEMLQKNISPKDYIYNLEQVYNARKQKRTVII